MVAYGPPVSRIEGLWRSLATGEAGLMRPCVPLAVVRFQPWCDSSLAGWTGPLRTELRALGVSELVERSFSEEIEGDGFTGAPGERRPRPGVPAEVPLLFQNSRSCTPSESAKKSVPLTLVKDEG